MYVIVNAHDSTQFWSGKSDWVGDIMLAAQYAFKIDAEYIVKFRKLEGKVIVFNAHYPFF